jgi:hypothetical protein
MRVQWARLLLLVACAAAALALNSSMASFSAEPGVLVPLAATTLLLAVLALVLVGESTRQPSGRAVMAWRRRASYSRATVQSRRCWAGPLPSTWAVARSVGALTHRSRPATISL